MVGKRMQKYEEKKPGFPCYLWPRSIGRRWPCPSKIRKTYFWGFSKTNKTRIIYNSPS